jgi:hypothetical protein
MIKTNEIIDINLEEKFENKTKNRSKETDRYERNDSMVKRFMIYKQSDLQNPMPPLDPLEPLDVWRRRPMPRRLFQTSTRSPIEIPEPLVDVF